jgi:hypothetical protein
MKWTDKDIDKLYSESSERLAFEYKEGYWDEFDAQLSEVQDADGAKAPLSDAAIDSMYAASSAGLAFDYKNDYWNEFNASLPDGAATDSPKPALTDVEIDAMYAASAAGLSFDYNNSYWNEFNASLPQGAAADSPKPALTDTEIDAMYAASAAGLSFDYKGAYWKDFNASFPADAVLTDNGIDELYQESAGDLAFEYKPSYWEEFKGRIRRQRRPDFLWFTTAFSFVGVLGVMAFMNSNSVSDSKTVTANSNKIETQKNKISISQSKVENTGTSSKVDASANSVTSSPANSGEIGNGIVNPSSAILPVGSQVVDPTVLVSIPVVQSPVRSQVVPVTPEVPVLALTPAIPTIPSNVTTPGQDIRPVGPDTNTPSPNGTIEAPVVVETQVTPVTPGQDIRPVGPDTNTPSPNGTQQASVVVETQVTPGQDIRPVGPDANTPSPNGTPENGSLVENNAIIVNPTLNGAEPNNPKDVNSTQPLSADELAALEIETEVRLPYGAHDPLDLFVSLPAPYPGSPLSFSRGAFVLAYVQGIGGLSQSLVIPSDEISNSFGIGIGTEVHKGNFTWNFGVNALVENHNDLVLNRTAKVYGFGSDVYQFNIDYKQMYTLEAMIGVGYNLGRHRIDLGVRPSFVMSSRVHIEELGTSTTEFASDNDYNESRDLFGFMDGLHRFGIKPTIGYMFKVSPSISLGATIGIELRPSINEDFIKGVNNTRPIDGQIYLRKTLSFRKK